ncbi:alpha/beta fold hydrolase [Pseudalkalibacillus sp. Hm43]|uniref:alpha/beta fold hydrolase n=1 Tax=Pseudalkalibacillus sp. Hm43 TaxID=3450742 RepID=UPI003F440298
MILHTESYGEGDPIVFLHTGLQTGELDFSTIKERFQDQYKVVLPDLRGHGKSHAENLENYLETCIEDLYETLESLNIDEAHIVSCSLGSFVALGFAKKYPDKIISLTVSGVMAEEPTNWPELHRETVRQQTALLQDPESVAYHDQLHSSDWKQFMYMCQDQDWYPFQFTADISDIKPPMLFIVGEQNKEEVKTVSTYQSMKDNLHVCVLPFAGHLVHSEQTDLYTTILNNFLNQYSLVKNNE